MLCNWPLLSCWMLVNTLTLDIVKMQGLPHVTVCLTTLLSLFNPFVIRLPPKIFCIFVVILIQVVNIVSQFLGIFILRDNRNVRMCWFGAISYI